MTNPKYRLIKDGKIVGYEIAKRLNGCGPCLWMYSETNDDLYFKSGFFIPHDHKDAYTGLKDKNDVEIYEGDILKHDLWGNSIIVWEHGMFRGIGGGHDVTLADHQLNRSRVIGNKWTHPELLKEES